MNLTFIIAFTCTTHEQFNHNLQQLYDTKTERVELPKTNSFFIISRLNMIYFHFCFQRSSPCRVSGWVSQMWVRQGMTRIRMRIRVRRIFNADALIPLKLTLISKRSYKAFLLNFILSTNNNYYLPWHVITYVCTNLGEDRN